MKAILSLRHRKMHLTKRNSPYFWRKIRSINSPTQLRNWQLVLDSQNIPFQIYRIRGRYQIYVPPMAEKMAAWQINTYEKENLQANRPAIPLPTFPKAYYIFLPLFLLALWHAMRQGEISSPSFLPDHSLWLKLGALDSVRIQLYSEYQRAITALSLHVNDSHLIGNLFFGSLFLFLLARRIGYGRAFLLTSLCGAIGNLVALAFHEGPWLSVGFSTAVFAAAGVMAGIMASAATNRHKFLLPAGAALALLALLGTEGVNTDYAAHCAGLACGFAGGLWEGWRIRRHIPGLPNFTAFILAIGFYFCAWLISFYGA